ncbi:MAG: HDIG domain-containing protein [Candidatus Omnitrophica bacterium]|nr:HDIG domain-containing protein [Candidatus Omnitrophota bacterium]
MIKVITRNKIKFALLVLAFLLFSLIARINPAIPLLLITLHIYLRSRKIQQGGHILMNLTLLFMVIFTPAYYIIRGGLDMSYIPFSLVPMLATLLFNNLEITFLLTTAVSFSIASISGNFFPLGLVSFIGGVLSGILVKDARKRSTVIRAGVITGIAQAVVLIFSERFQLGNYSGYLALLFNGLASSIIVLGVLSLFEYLFKTVTNISLLELTDFNHPLLRQMVQDAPGTYHHSLVVGNLSENASLAVGANALLARVGAYYHDIGKIQKPEYFSENQGLRESKHDNLSPVMSKLVIMNHVKEGVELARKHKLNPLLIDFIQQHHGSSLVYYFYRRAMENLEDDQEIKEEGFRYPGPKPNTKETAIVLLADSVEAATRALKDPSPDKIKEVVYKIINNKFIDAQLDACDLTLKDLENISAVFVRILSGIYHSRASYPEESNNGLRKT